MTDETTRKGVGRRGATASLLFGFDRQGGITGVSRMSMAGD